MPKVPGAPTGGGSLANQRAPSQAARGPSGGNAAGVGRIRVPGGKTRALPGSTGIGTPSQDAFAFGIGTEISKTSATADRAGLYMQQVYNETEARQADNSLAAQLREIDANYQQLKGRDAFDGYGAYEKAIAKAIRTSGEGTTNHVSQGKYQAQASRRQAAALGAGQKYRMNELNKWNRSELNASATNNATDLTNSYQVLPEQRAEGVTYPQEGAETRLAANITDIGISNSKHPDAIKADVAKAISDAKVAAITSRLQSDPMGAEALYEYTVKTKGFISEEQREAMFKQVKAYADHAEQAAAADAAYTTNAGNVAEASEAIRKEYRDKPDMAKAIVKQMHERKIIDDKAKDDYEVSVSRTTHGQIMRGEITQIEQIPPAETIGTAQYNNLVNVLDSKLKRHAVPTDPAAKEAVEAALTDGAAGSGTEAGIYRGDYGHLSPTDQAKLGKLAKQKEDALSRGEAWQAPPSMLTVKHYHARMIETRQKRGQNHKRDALIKLELTAAFAQATAGKQADKQDPNAELSLAEQESIYAKFNYGVIRDGLVDFFDQADYLWNIEIENPDTGNNFSTMELYAGARELVKRGIKYPTTDQIEAILVGPEGK